MRKFIAKEKEYEQINPITELPLNSTHKNKFPKWILDLKKKVTKEKRGHTNGKTC